MTQTQVTVSTGSTPRPSSPDISPISPWEPRHFTQADRSFSDASTIISPRERDPCIPPQVPPKPPNLLRQGTFPLKDGSPTDNGSTGHTFRRNDSSFTLSPSKEVQWKLDLWGTLRMIAFMLAGVGFALGHHFFYNSLRGVEVAPDDGKWNWNTSSQEWKTRYGTALAFISKTTMTVAIGFAYQEHLWRTLRKKSVSIAGIDAAFAANDNALSFFNWDFLKNVKVGYLLALLGWSLSLSAFITPATLTVVPHTRITERPGMAAVLNYSAIRAPAQREALALSNPSNVNFVRLAHLTAAAMDTLPSRPYFPTNQSYAYNVSFEGPSIKCEPPKSQNTIDMMDAIFNRVNLTLPASTKSNKIIYTPVFLGMRPPFWMMNQTLSDTNTLDNITAFVERCLPAAISTGRPVANISRLCTTFAPDRADLMWIRAKEERYVCNVYRTAYNVTFVAYQDRQIVQKPYHWSFIERDPDYGYEMIMQSAREVLSGTVTYVDITPCDRSGYCNSSNVNSSPFMMGSGLSESTMLQALHLSPKYMGGEEPYSGNVGNWTMGEMIESLSRNLTVNAFYIAPFMQQIPQNVTLRVSTPMNVFAYNARNLLLAYGLALLATLFSLALGLRAIFLNGVSHNSSFSGMLCTTRNPTLDALAKGHTLGAEPLDRDIGRTRLRFGALMGKRVEGDRAWVRGRRVQRLGFGVEGEVGS